MPGLSQVRVRVDDIERAASFYGAVFGWDLRLAQSGIGHEATVLTSTIAETAPSAGFVLTDDPGEPDVRLGFTVPDLNGAAKGVEGLGGKVERADGAVVRCRDDQGIPLLLGVDDGGDPGRASRQARGVLGVIFVFVEVPDRAAEFYRKFAGWTFEAIGRDRDILFVKDGPPVGIRSASKAPGGQSGEVTFHISVAEHESLTEAIDDHGGQVEPARAAGIFATQTCRDDQGTAFSLWYQPTST